MMQRLAVALGMLVWLGMVGASSGEYVWIEGEAPSLNPLSAEATGGVEHPDYLSGGKWIKLAIGENDVAKRVPAEGALLGYDFTVARPGAYEVWNRLGMESIRSAFDWRVDNGDWKTMATGAPYTDMMDVGFWNELDWVKLGTADLAQGKHTLQIRLMPAFAPQKEKDADGKEVTQNKPKSIMYFADCFCLSRGEFVPNGKEKPDANGMNESDRKAAAQVFEVKSDGQPGERVEVSLTGAWQVCRYDEFEPADRTGPDTSLPDGSKVAWSAIPVPSDKYQVRPDLDMAHRLVYRTRIDVPADMAGRSFFVHFPCNNMISSVFVNGRFCGWTKAMIAPWDCDVSAGMKPGGTNELCVVIKDTYYALSPQKSKQPFGKSAFIPRAFLTQSFIGQNMDFPVNSVPEAGILGPPTLVACGRVYAADVFAKPSVNRKELGLEITLHNPGANAANATLETAIEPLAGGAAEKTFAPRQATLAPGAETVLQLTEAWANPKLWWPDDPQQYYAVTRVSVDGRLVDVLRTKFGFREWEWNSSQFKLNGIPWHGRADTTVLKDASDTIHLWRAHGQTMMRFWGSTWCGMPRPEALDVLDKTGMVVRFSGIFDGEGGNYLHGLADPALFDNWTTHLEQWTKAFRNHPSILIWSIENEITFINSRNFGMSKVVEPMVAKGAKRVMELDPTRPVMVDGGRCLVNEDLPVNGCHYDEAAWRLYPDEAYTFELTDRSHLVAFNDWGVCPWRLVPNRPVFMGESYYLRGYRPAAFAQFGGEASFVGWKGCKPGAGVLAKMLSEGYRWHGVAAFHFWLDQEQISDYYNSWQPVAVLGREWNWTFAGGSAVERTLKLLNDTRFAEPIDLGWELDVDGKRAAGEKQPFQVPPGESVEKKLTLNLPPVQARTKAAFILTCARGGKEVFRDEKEVWLIPSDAGPKPALQAGELVVLDPVGPVKARLQSRGIAFTEIGNDDPIPATAKVVVIGPDALDPRQATDTKWKSVAARGGRVLVLDQSHPLHFAAIPADLEPSGYAGRIAFAENLAHPVFAGLDQPDFFTWSKDHLVYRNVYRKATRGAKSLAHCDQDLSYTCLAECEVNDGLMILCQMLVGTKLGTDPVADRLFDNLLAYGAEYRPVRKAAAVVFDEGSPRGKLLADSGLVFDRATDPLEAVKGGKAQIVVADATPKNLQALAAHPDALSAFTRDGGWLFLWGLTPEGLGDFNKIVGVDQMIRPFIRERVTLPAQRDPILSGLTQRDVVLESGQQIAFYAGRFMASDVFSYIVDYDDVAPFFKMPDWQYFNPGQATPDADKEPSNLVNGFTGADDWRYIFQIPLNRKPSLEWDMELPREETLTEFGLTPNGFYKLLTGIELTFDHDTPSAVRLKIEPKNVEQSFELPERKARLVHLKITDWEDSQKGNCVGIDNLWFKAKRSPDFYGKVKPLLNIGALVKYPQGKGGVILCQVNIPEHEQLPENAQKKRNIVATLLRNVGAVFAGGKVIVAGVGLSYEPIALNETCNLFLTHDKEWFAGETRDLGQFPVGEQKFAGVTYLVRDFRTSPLPCAIALAGQGLKDKPMEVRGIKVGKKADALFFLHTWRQAGRWQAPAKGDATPPIVWKYVVHYADGQTADVPVRYDEGAANWIQKQPQGGKNAVVAWAAPLTRDPAGDQAVVYQMQWNNPHPAVDIASIDVAYDAASQNRYGVPVVLAITAGREAK